MHRRGRPCGKSASRAQINRRKSFYRGRREWGIVCVGTPPQKMLHPNEQVYSRPVNAQNNKRKGEWDSARGNRIPPIKMCRVVSVRENFPSLFFLGRRGRDPAGMPTYITEHTKIQYPSLSFPPPPPANPFFSFFPLFPGRERERDEALHVSYRRRLKRTIRSSKTVFACLSSSSLYPTGGKRKKD